MHGREGHNPGGVAAKRSQYLNGICQDLLFGGQVRQDIDAGISDNEDFVDSRRLMKAYSLALYAISSKFLYMAINP